MIRRIKYSCTSVCVYHEILCRCLHLTHATSSTRFTIKITFYCCTQFYYFWSYFHIHFHIKIKKTIFFINLTRIILCKFIIFFYICYSFSLIFVYTNKQFLGFNVGINSSCWNSKIVRVVAAVC